MRAHGPQRAARPAEFGASGCVAYNRIMRQNPPAAASAEVTASTQHSPSSVDPARIHADRAAGTVELDWRDGHRTVYDATSLRWLCPCAYCRGEAGLPGWLDSAPSLTAEQTRLVDLQMVGQYAIAPTWGDGHHTGFYTFVMLRDRCPCEVCVTRHSAEARAAEGSRSATHHDHASHAPGDHR